MSLRKSAVSILCFLMLPFALAAANYISLGMFIPVANAQSLPTGCAAGGSFETSASGFDQAKLDMTSVSVNTNGGLILDTGAGSLDINNIIVPFEQVVSTVFLLEGAGYRSDIGWFVRQEAEDKLGYTISGTLPFQDLVSAGVTINYLFRTVEDDTDSGCCNGGNGILDTFYDENDNYLGNDVGLTETALQSWGFTPNSGSIPGFVNNGEVDPRDMRKFMANFAAGVEIVYFLHADGDIPSRTYYSKDGWSPDNWNPGNSDKDDAIIYFNLAIASPEQGGPAADINTGVIPTTVTQGFIPTAARDRLGNPDNKTGYPAKGLFDVQMSGLISKRVIKDEKFNHFLVAAPPADPFKWIIGAEDLLGGGDADFNDMLIMIERKTGGVARLKSSEAIGPAAPAYITSVTIKVQDKMPCNGDTQIDYYLSIDDGANWVEVTDWISIATPNEGGASVTGWTYGFPEETFRKSTINFSEMGLTGNKLIWKAELISENDACVPEISFIDLNYNAALNREFSRSSPTILGNILYSASFETPDYNWVEKDLRGHLRSERLYDPLNPTGGLAIVENWDAGAVLTASTPSTRQVITPNITLNMVSGEILGTGDGTVVTFTGTFSSAPIVHSTISITDGLEVFIDKHTTELEGSLTGTGTIDRFTGEFSVTFNSPPGNGVDVVVDYVSYITSSVMDTFNSGAVDKDDLALDNSMITDTSGTRYVYDFNNDGNFSEADATWLKNWVVGYSDGASVKKDWLLSSIDHSSPAIVGAPGLTSWYFGTDVTDDVRDSFDMYRCQQRNRKTIALVGSRMGMLNAFYAGEYRPYYIDESLFSGVCSAGSLESFRNAVNPPTCFNTNNDPTYPGPGKTCSSGGALNMIINRGYYDWTSGSPNYGIGSELWSAIPADQLAKLKNNKMKGEDRAFVDASPAVAHVQFKDNSWHAIVISAEGNGGDHIFALDITDPNTPTFLWEFADPDLFRSRSSPSVAVIGQIVSETGVKWVAFFVSGINTEAGEYPSIYMLDVETGKKLERIYLDTEPSGIGGTPSGQPAVLDSDGNGYADKLYIGTDKGYMYKVNLPDDPSSSGGVISVCTLYNAGQPIYASPSAVVKNTVNTAGEIDYRTVVFFGTGDSPSQEDSVSDQYYFYAIEDKDEIGACSPGSMLWNYALPAGQRIFASAFATAGQVYFGTSASDTDDPCAPPTPAASAAGQPTGVIFALNAETGAVLYQEAVGNITSTPVVDDEQLYIKTTDGSLFGFGGNTFQNKTKQGGLSEAKVKSWREISQ
ncbi:Type IV fimbrial biogenesis protein PilY1 [hydrothermal vent metagenome]|uniref:Type IV fimbrial biogenesis protein PilY1 n=1 Tax=hydrothermal vent metagenome TaxID=652676 RepID=A0A3B1CH37_9ZZZZ